MLDQQPDVPSTESGRLSREQVRDLVRSLITTDYLRLLLIARSYAHMIRREAGDLLHEALVRALDGRSCRAGVTAPQFVGMIMKSITADALRSAEARLDVRGLWTDPADEAVAACDDADAEADLHRTIDAARLRARVDAVLAADPALARFAEAVRDGATGQALADRLDVDQRGLATLRRRFARRMRKVLPPVEDARTR